MLFKNTPGEKIYYIVDKLMSFRQAESAKLENNPELDLGDVTTVNMTLLKGGAQGKYLNCQIIFFNDSNKIVRNDIIFYETGNVVPPVLSVTFDIRIANDIKLDEFEKRVNRNKSLIIFYNAY